MSDSLFQSDSRPICFNEAIFSFEKTNGFFLEETMLFHSGKQAGNDTAYATAAGSQIVMGVIRSNCDGSDQVKL
jgi:hypothetical protein